MSEAFNIRFGRNDSGAAHSKRRMHRNFLPFGFGHFVNNPSSADTDAVNDTDFHDTCRPRWLFFYGPSTNPSSVHNCIHKLQVGGIQAERRRWTTLRVASKKEEKGSSRKS
uniref:WGS project CBMG000000000 data, contig CS5907-c000221 n=1 Tax=Fusarium acuminatum CS5907 TaxID=1318461 RepID=A0A096PEZ9_9HYPO|nr:unnamed protein product [Fusarium acuminatum CS5907]